MIHDDAEAQAAISVLSTSSARPQLITIEEKLDGFSDKISGVLLRSISSVNCKLILRFQSFYYPTTANRKRDNSHLLYFRGPKARLVLKIQKYIVCCHVDYDFFMYML